MNSAAGFESFRVEFEEAWIVIRSPRFNFKLPTELEARINLKSVV